MAYFLLFLIGVAGVIAVVLSINKSETAQEIKGLLKSMGENIKDLSQNLIKLFVLLKNLIQEKIGEENSQESTSGLKQSVTEAVISTEEPQDTQSSMQEDPAPIQPDNSSEISNSLNLPQDTAGNTPSEEFQNQSIPKDNSTENKTDDSNVNQSNNS